MKMALNHRADGSRSSEYTLISRDLALYVISVRRTKGLPKASFRLHLTMDALAVQLYTSHHLDVLGSFTHKSLPMLGKQEKPLRRDALTYMYTII